jgi:hypothetical protein
MSNTTVSGANQEYSQVGQARLAATKDIGDDIRTRWTFQCVSVSVVLIISSLCMDYEK